MNNNIPIECFNSIYKDNYNQLFRYCKRILKNEHTAHDAVHDVFLKLFKQDYSKISDHINQWLYTVCYNHSLKLLKKQNRLISFFEEDESLDEERTPSEQLEFQEKVRLLSKFMKKLSKNQRQVLKHRFYNDLSYDLTAKKVKLTSGNVGFIQNRALNKLRVLMKKALSK
jgi:RNA polymerase sigma-70 factor (ECF subfamily)